MNHVAVHDILESDFDAPITDEILKEIGFHHGFYISGFLCDNGTHTLWAHKVEDGYIVNDNYAGAYHKYTVHTPHWKTVGGLKLLIEALKGDE